MCVLFPIVLPSPYPFKNRVISTVLYYLLYIYILYPLAAIHSERNYGFNNKVRLLNNINYVQFVFIHLMLCVPIIIIIHVWCFSTRRPPWPRRCGRPAIVTAVDNFKDRLSHCTSVVPPPSLRSPSPGVFDDITYGKIYI